MAVSVYNQLHSVQRFQLELDIVANVLLQQRTATFHQFLLHGTRVVSHCQHTHIVTVPSRPLRSTREVYSQTHSRVS